MPWERVYKVNIATQIVNMAIDPEDPKANNNGAVLEAVTKDHLDTGLLRPYPLQCKRTKILRLFVRRLTAYFGVYESPRQVLVGASAIAFA